MRIEINKNIREENLRASEALADLYRAKGVRAVGLLGAPGSGKTTLLEELLPALMERARVAVIEGDLATDNDARRIERVGARAVQINTNGACHLDAVMVLRALEGLDLDALDLLLIENVGNLVCPIGFPLGEAARVVIISTAEGEDKPLKYPNAILHADALAITKVDIARHVGVEPKRMADYARSIRPDIRVFFSGRAGGPDSPLEALAEDGRGTLADYLLG